MKTYLDYFSEISAIPRESGHEGKIRAYLIAYAKKKGYSWQTDAVGNVLITKEATEKFKNKSPVILQGHMDMVCEKEKNSTHNFSKDPISIIESKGFLTAKGTTLGADNGIALAMALAILDQDETPPITFVATVKEEVDMSGAINFSLPLHGKFFINIDSEEEGVVVCGSAGGETAVLSLSKEYDKRVGKKYFELTLNGLCGGHSGIEIDKGYANGLQMMAKFLQQNQDLKLCSFSGGTKDNAICREATAIVAANEDIKLKVTRFLETEKRTLKKKDRGISIDVKQTDQRPCLSKKNVRELFALLKKLPHGVHSRLANGQVECSSNLAIVQETNEAFIFVDSLRSCSKSKLHRCKKEIENLSTIANIRFEGAYPTWEYMEKSELRDRAVELYQKQTSRKMKIDVIHAGLECGVFSEKFPWMECISIGPNIYDVHTPEERLDLASAQRFFQYLKELIISL